MNESLPRMPRHLLAACSSALSRDAQGWGGMGWVGGWQSTEGTVMGGGGGGKPGPALSG